MTRVWYLKLIVVLGAAVLSFFALWPNLDEIGILRSPVWIKNVFSGRIHPGLDIRGGLRLMYTIDTDEYIEDQRNRYSDRLLRKLVSHLSLFDKSETDALTIKQIQTARKRIKIKKIKKHSLKIHFTNKKDRELASASWFKDTFHDLQVIMHDETSVELKLRELYIERLEKNVTSQAKLTVSNRINTLGLTQANVTGHDSNLIIEIPGATEDSFKRIRGIIQKTAKLDFKILDEEGTSFLNQLRDLPKGISLESENAPNGEKKTEVRSHYLVSTGNTCDKKAKDCVSPQKRLQDYLSTIILPDPDHQLIISQVHTKQDRESWRTFYVWQTSQSSGEDIDDAYLSFDPDEGNRPVVIVQFNASGAIKFEDLTKQNINRRMAIVLDNIANSAPVIQSRIGGGTARITLGQGEYQSILDEANDLVVVLKAGVLPAPLRPANEQLIGPTLGRDSVKQGAMGAIIGIALVLIFMLLYYQIAGFVADIMVLLNLLFILAIMALFEATLTLPGIAALALTVGMAVDANVLINERIREELLAGKKLKTAVDQGYQKAFSSILDSQLTTFIAGIVLFQYGTGPIKGFAVMLMIGIATSLFTGIFCSRVFLDWLVRGLRIKKFKVG